MIISWHDYVISNHNGGKLGNSSRCSDRESTLRHCARDTEANPALNDSAMAFRIILLCALLSVNFISISAKFCYGSLDTSCSSYHVCCNNECVLGTDCIGQYCILDSDCSLNQVCCNDYCSYSCDTVGVVIGGIFGVVLFICLVAFVACFCIRRRQRLRGPPVLGQRVISTQTTTTTQNYRPIPNHPQQGPYQGQQAYGYQQGYAQPPPQYAGYGATNPTGPSQSGSVQSRPHEEASAVVTAGNGNTDQKNNYFEASAPPM